jgi:hypothetical protein
LKPELVARVRLPLQVGHFGVGQELTLLVGRALEIDALDATPQAFQIGVTPRRFGRRVVAAIRRAVGGSRRLSGKGRRGTHTDDDQRDGESPGSKR